MSKAVYECVKCSNKNPMPPKSARSATCVNCGAVHAIVQDEDGDKAMALYFKQPPADEPSQGSLKANLS